MNVKDSHKESLRLLSPMTTRGPGIQKLLGMGNCCLSVVCMCLKCKDGNKGRCLAIPICHFTFHTGKNTIRQKKGLWEAQGWQNFSLLSSLTTCLTVCCQTNKICVPLGESRIDAIFTKPCIKSCMTISRNSKNFSV